MDEVRAGVGSSRLDDSTAAGRQAAEQAVRALGGVEPALVLTYAAMRYDHARLLAGIRSVSGNCPLVGATSSGQFFNGEIMQPGEGVCVLMLTAGPYRFGVASRAGLQAEPSDVGQLLARAALAKAGTPRAPHGGLLVLADSLSGDLQGLLNGIYRVTGATVPVVGGASGADRELKTSYVFHDGEVFNDAAVAVWIATDRPLRAVSAHGWQARGLPMCVTRADGPVVHEISNRPAMEVYRESFRTPDTPQDADMDWWKEFHPSHAFGLIEPDGTENIRGAYVGQDGLPRTFVPLPPFSGVRVMTATPNGLLGVCDQVVSGAIDGRDASVLLMFSCSARMEILGDRASEEASRLQQAAGQVATFGFYTYGEFARNGGGSGFHNATLAAIAL